MRFEVMRTEMLFSREMCAKCLECGYMASVRVPGTATRDEIADAQIEAALRLSTPPMDKRRHGEAKLSPEIFGDAVERALAKSGLPFAPGFPAKRQYEAEPKLGTGVVYPTVEELKRDEALGRFARACGERMAADTEMGLGELTRLAVESGIDVLRLRPTHEIKPGADGGIVERWWLEVRER